MLIASAIQGLGVGFVWIPLSIVTFATLEKRLVPDRTSIFHLARNMGSSIFISVSIAVVLRQSKVSYADLTPNVTLFSEAYRMPGLNGMWDLGSASGVSSASREVARQATMIGYIDGFLLFAIVAAAAIPLVGLVRVERSGAAESIR